MTTPVLWQFKCSHFCERVRWALDWKGLAYRERSGEDFGVADLTLAALLSTFLVPPEFPYPPPRPFPEPVQEYRRSLERFAALAWAREIYAKHRSPRTT